MLDVDKMRNIATNLHSVTAREAFGGPGPAALVALISFVTQLYRTIEPSTRSVPLTVFVRPAGVIAKTLPSEQPKNVISRSNFVVHELEEESIVEVGPNGRFSIYAPSSFALDELSKEVVMYRYDAQQEVFTIGGQHFEVVNPDSAHASVFAHPTFSSLEEALERFRSNKVRTSSCFILNDIWNDEKRIFLRTKPEWIMRRSLHQYLRDVFPDAEVRPEQIVDESHPVDIKVTWADTNKRALIEIKWLGKSLDDGGNVTATHSDGRARDGAKQLAEYLDSDASAAPGMRTMGYLIVIDARRWGAEPGALEIEPKRAFHYRDRDIAYDPRYDEVRADFAKPVRMFAEPIASATAAVAA